MAFIKKTWLDRITEFPTRRTLTKSDQSTEVVDVARNEGDIMQEGDAFSATNMNDLEQRIYNAINELNQNLTSKIDANKIVDVKCGVWANQTGQNFNIAYDASHYCIIGAYAFGGTPTLYQSFHLDSNFVNIKLVGSTVETNRGQGLFYNGYTLHLILFKYA